MATELVCCYADGHSPFVRELLNLIMRWDSSWGTFVLCHRKAVDVVLGVVSLFIFNS